MRTRKPSFAVPGLLAAALLTAVPLAAAPAAADDVVVPDSRDWTVEQALVNLRASDRGLRLAALQRLSREPGPTIQQWIAEAARYDPEPRIRYEAVVILGKRREPESLPALMFIGERDTDDRVRTAARTIVQAAAPPPAHAQPAPAPSPDPAPGLAPAPAPPPQKRYDEHGHELPPGYLDGQPAGAGAPASFDSPLGRPVIDEGYIDLGRREIVHHGFITAPGYDGAIGTPRDTLARTRVGLQFGLGYSGIVNTVASGNHAGMEVRGLNDFTSTDFSILVDGAWSPWEFLEIGLAFELLTVEKLDHAQAWLWVTDDDIEDEHLDPAAMDNPGDVFNDASYGGAALGLLSLDLKALVHRSDLLRLGLALRVTFPTHTGERFESGIGAPALFRPTNTTDRRPDNRTLDGALWGVEPGIVFSLAPVRNLTVYGDVGVTMTFLNYTWYRKVIRTGGVVLETSNKLSAFNAFLIPALGAQYRFLDETLGVQLALKPAIYLGTAADSSLASFGIVPGISYRLIEHLDISAALSIEAGGNAPHSFLCTDLAVADEQSALPCGVGRRLGIAVKASWVF